jgi:hypothetical protein
MSGRRGAQAQPCGRSWSSCSRPRPPTVREPWRCRGTTCPRPVQRIVDPTASEHARHDLGIERAPRGGDARDPRTNAPTSRPRSSSRKPTPAGASPISLRAEPERSHRRRRGQAGISTSAATTSGRSASVSRRSASASPARATTSKPAPARICLDARRCSSPTRVESLPRGTGGWGLSETSAVASLGSRAAIQLPRPQCEPFRRRGESRRTGDDPRRDGNRYM